MLADAQRRGTPLAPLLAHRARALRTARRQQLLERAERLPAQLVVPAALLLLPAALLVVLTPVVRAGLAAVA